MYSQVNFLHTIGTIVYLFVLNNANGPQFLFYFIFISVFFFEQIVSKDWDVAANVKKKNGTTWSWIIVMVKPTSENPPIRS